MNVIYCDKCHFEWPVEETDIETIELDKARGTKMRFFRCPECGAEYVVDVTDAELRKQISVFKKMQRKYRRLYADQVSEISLREYLTKIQTKRRELMESERVLRRRWTNGE